MWLVVQLDSGRVASVEVVSDSQTPARPCRRVGESSRPEEALEVCGGVRPRRGTWALVARRGALEPGTGVGESEGCLGGAGSRVLEGAAAVTESALPRTRSGPHGYYI